ncbi:MAG: hypothetical protein A2279_07285 [Stygiobacter sp. RIFOXYA12_FULL_38_9]|nr:MAG: hypothetical protein A2279_07285 [Stygiobacter sp. RIFOXYA12_FULL_38_9]OGV08510.1 MAG: hypothetical protein A2299_00455 [Stygiobacter sp. RIFOXYB2_FULL_37_11]OGV10285.1 MAG: hypothetical protein A2237_10900 [Stygiobacter sp. RIFOXYA2_FULL_38_8]OGV14816.1 MAG: hypothetical protein A2440_09960 [Stygiobacter sp. RIFOXYC2_FULL_38_25]OGV79309.1 MAG: hypothetical protein A2X65_02330 [Stygiobacter sp. GWF2_38_21]
MKHIQIPTGYLYNTTDEDEAAKKRREIKEKLLRGEIVRVTKEGTVKDAEKSKNEGGIIVPEGKLASFYWYENDPELLEDEKQVMRRYFPQFQLDKLKDGRLYWTGVFKTDLRPGGEWHLQAIYEHNHPNNSSWGGSVKIYSILPDLEEISKELKEPIPHLLADSKGNVYLCTARKEDVRDGKEMVTSAASSLSWAAKWIAAFELWMEGNISTAEFSNHNKI